MFEMLGWDSDDDYLDEEEEFINRNDPLHRDSDGFSPYEKGEFEDLSIEEKVDFIESLDEYTDSEKARLIESAVDTDTFDVEDAAMFAGIVGGMLSEEEDPDTEAAEKFAQEVEYISLKKARETPQKKGTFPVRPFEKWVNDVLTGKKTWEDD